MDVVDWSLVDHHLNSLARNNLWILTIILLSNKATTPLFTLVNLMSLTMWLSRLLLLNRAINDVILLLLYKIISTGWTRYFIIWLLKLLLSKLILAYLTLVFRAIACSFLLIIWVPSIVTSLNLVCILALFIYILVVLMVILCHLLLICLLLIKLQGSTVVIKYILLLRGPVPILRLVLYHVLL